MDAIPLEDLDDAEFWDNQPHANYVGIGPRDRLHQQINEILMNMRLESPVMRYMTGELPRAAFPTTEELAGR